MKNILEQFMIVSSGHIYNDYNILNSLHIFYSSNYRARFLLNFSCYR